MDIYPLTFTPPPLYPYPCRDRNGSLVVVPPDTSLSEHICIPSECPFFSSGCRVEGCLFRPTWMASRISAKTESQIRAGRAYQARMRAQLCNTRGEPLAQTCWNCVQIRYTDGGFVCSLDEKPVTQTAGYMQQKAACDARLFEWRTYLDILPLSRQAQRRIQNV
jgi:hypothetical protein